MRRPLLFAGPILFLSLAVCAGCAGPGTPVPASTSDAAQCKEPVSAPHYQVGEKFTWNYADGKQRVWEVTGVEGNLTQITWSDEGAVWANENAGTYFFDQDWVIRKGITKQGEVLLSPKIGVFSKLGIKDLDFPLQVGKTWEFTHRSRMYGGVNPTTATTFSAIVRVVGCEEVATLAGKFLALKIETVEASSISSGWRTMYRWYSPDAKNIVKVEFNTWNRTAIASTAGMVSFRWSTHPEAYELMKLELR
jgi:hypothetical protein